MTQILHIGDSTVAIADIRPHTGATKRECEIEAEKEIFNLLGLDFRKLTHTPDGAPALEGTHISITHSRRLAAVAINPHTPIGIDAEEWRDTLSRVKEKFLSPEEIETFTAQKQILTAWTVKEAVYKIVGPEAVDFKKKIAISPTLGYARSCGNTYTATTLQISQTTITLASKES